jgi:hypothetical protein
MELKNLQVVKKLPVEKGTSKTGVNWQKQTVVLETNGEYPKKIAMSFFGNTADEIGKVKEGDFLDCNIDIESREYNGKYYTDVKCWKFKVLSASAPVEKSNDLPF